MTEKSDDGYDSDGVQGPFFHAIDIEGEQDIDKDNSMRIVTDTDEVSTSSEKSATPMHVDIPPD